MGSSKTENRKQLYFLLSKLASRIYDVDILGATIGYSIVDSLKRYSPSSGSEEERHFEEIKCIYSHFESLLRMYSFENEEVPLRDMGVDVDKFIQSILQPNAVFDERELSSDLLKIVSESLQSRKNYVDVLRRAGKKIYDAVSDRGSFERPVDYLHEDYASIENCFRK